MRGLVGLVVAGGLWAIGPGASAHSVVASAPPDLPVVTSCWPEVRVFDSLKNGPADLCRSHLRYEPGELDCQQFFDMLCWVFVPATGEWVQTRTTSPPVVLPCPDGPEPPVCPRLR